jgi:hypothetical protein
MGREEGVARILARQQAADDQAGGSEVGMS